MGSTNHPFSYDMQSVFYSIRREIWEGLEEDIERERSETQYLVSILQDSEYIGNRIKSQSPRLIHVLPILRILYCSRCGQPVRDDFTHELGTQLGTQASMAHRRVGLPRHRLRNLKQVVGLEYIRPTSSG